MSKESISWVHLSDLHLKSKGDEKQHDILRALENSFGDLQPPDLLLVTGDLVYGNRPDDPIQDQYAIASEWLGKVEAIWGLDKTRVFVVPGNHDVDRTEVTTGDMLYTQSLLDLPQKGMGEVLRDLWAGTAQRRQRKAIGSRLQAYVTFLKDSGYTHLLTEEDTITHSIFFYARVIDIRSVSVGIAGFNTAWSSCGEGEKGKLLFGMGQAIEAEEKLANAEVRIALAHHPVSWINTKEEHQFKQSLERGYDYFLHGHEHTVGLSKDMRGKRLYTIGAGALRQDDDDRMCYSHVVLPEGGDSPKLDLYYRMPTTDGCAFKLDERTREKKPDRQRVIQLVPKPSLGTTGRPATSNVSSLPGNNRSTSAPQPAHNLISPQTPKEFIEFKFSKLLRPILSELKSILEVSELFLAFLPPRDGTIVPELEDIEDYNNYQQVGDSLLRESEDFRKPRLASAIVSDVGGDILFCDSPSATPLLSGATGILERATARRRAWVKTSLSDQIKEWMATRDNEIVCSLKYVSSEDNRDIVGYVITPRNAQIGRNEAADPEVVQHAQRLIEEQLLPVKRP